MHMGGAGYEATRGRMLIAQMRCHTAPLRAILHHHDAISNPSPLCIYCPMHANDDQTHVMCECPMTVAEDAWRSGEEENALWWRNETAARSSDSSSSSRVR